MTPTPPDGLTLAEYNQGLIGSINQGLENRNHFIEWSIGIVGVFVLASWLTLIDYPLAGFLLDAFALSALGALFYRAVLNQSVVRQFGFVRRHILRYQFAKEEEQTVAAYTHLTGLITRVELEGDRVETWLGVHWDVLTLGFLPLVVFALGSLFVAFLSLVCSLSNSGQIAGAVALGVVTLASFGVWTGWILSGRDTVLYVHIDASPCPDCDRMSEELSKARETSEVRRWREDYAHRDVTSSKSA
jgi:hypothetical protein